MPPGPCSGSVTLVSRLRHRATGHPGTVPGLASTGASRVHRCRRAGRPGAAGSEGRRMDDPTRPLVSLADSADIAAALPYLVGFHPHESIVLVALGGPTGNRVGLTV